MPKEKTAPSEAQAEPKPCIRPEGDSPTKWSQLSDEAKAARIEQLRSEGRYFPAPRLEGVD